MRKTFTSSDPYVADLANAIEGKFPGKVTNVNKIVKDKTGRILTDYDIELDNFVIQVKSKGKGLTTQLQNTANSTNKTVIAYGPKIKGSVVKSAEKTGFKVFRTMDELLDYIK